MTIMLVVAPVTLQCYLSGSECSNVLCNVICNAYVKENVNRIVKFVSYKQLSESEIGLHSFRLPKMSAWKHTYCVLPRIRTYDTSATLDEVYPTTALAALTSSITLASCL